MNIVLLSTAYLPPVSWLAMAIKSGNIFIEAHETYPKQTYRNRCIIATSKGVLSLTVPVNRINGNHTVTSEIRIDNSTNWKKLHWRSITTAYNKAPYFLYYRDLFEPVFNTEHTSLLDFNQEILTIIFKSFRIEEIKVNLTEKYETDPLYLDLRESFHPKKRYELNTLYAGNRYIQVFEESIGFLFDLSCIDLLFNQGPDALAYLKNYYNNQSFRRTY